MYEEKCVFVIPTYNTYDKERKKDAEYKNICSVLESLISTVQKNLTTQQEIIIVNDGCTDETKESLNYFLKKKEKAKQLPERDKISKFEINKDKLKLLISIIEHDKNDRIGLNFAVVDGFRRALRKRPDFVIKIDSDGEHDPRQFPNLIVEILRGPDVKLVLFGARDQKDKRGFGFRMIRSDALNSIIDELEEYANKTWNDFPNEREKQVGIDQETKNLIEEKFPNKLKYVYF